MKKHNKSNPSKVDRDNPAWTAADFSRARPALEVVPNLVAAYERTRGRPVGRKKEVISLSVDKDVLAALRASGAGWQTRVNNLLKAAVGVV
ncbi:MAG: BrnA antitoxin family protein [Bdellovibrionales bacterium]